jgi:hypothetical protein
VLQPETWAWIEKAGILTVLLCNMWVLGRLGRFIFTQLQAKQWVPGWVYLELAHERDSLRVENKALRDVTLRAVKVTESALGEGR